MVAAAVFSHWGSVKDVAHRKSKGSLWTLYSSLGFIVICICLRVELVNIDMLFVAFLVTYIHDLHMNRRSFVIVFLSCVLCSRYVFIPTTRYRFLYGLWLPACRTPLLQVPISTDIDLSSATPVFFFFFRASSSVHVVVSPI